MKAEKLQLPGMMLLAVGLGVASVLPAQAQNPFVADKNSGWTFEVDPYLWIANPSIEASLPSSASAASTRSSTRASLVNFDTSIAAAAMVAAEVRYHSTGVYMDFAWLRLDSDAQNTGPSFSSANLKSDLMHVTLALTYSLQSQGNLHTELLAGGRLWNINEDFKTQSGTVSGFKSSRDKSWVDPVIGANLRYDLSRHWFVPVKGTVGGFGVTADLTWEVFGGVGYRFNNFCSATLGYRYLHEDYSKNDFGLNMDIQGLLLGVGFHF